MNQLINKYNKLPLIVKASFWFLFCGLLQKGISIFTTPVFTRIMTTSEFGTFNVFNSWSSVISILITFNLFGGVYTQGLVKFSNKRDEYSISLISLTTVLVITSYLLYLVTRNIWNNILQLTTLQISFMFMIIWGNSIFSFWSVEERVKMKYRKVVMVTILYSIFYPILSIILVLIMKDKVMARIVGLAICSLLFYLSIFLIKVKNNYKKVNLSFCIYALRFNSLLIPHYLSQTVLNSADRIMINNMVSSESAGIYSLAYSLSNIMVIFNTAFMQMLEPWMYNKIKDGKFKDIAILATPSFIAVAAVNLFLISFAPEVIRIFAPAEYHEAIWIIPSVTMSVYFMFVYNFFAAYEFYYEKTKYISIATLIGAVLNLLLNYLLIPIFGYYVAGYTTLACFIFYAFFHYYFMRKIAIDILKKDRIFNGQLILAISVVFMIFGIALTMSYNYTLIRYTVIIIGITIIFLKIKDIKGFLSSISKIRKKKVEE